MDSGDSSVGCSRQRPGDASAERVIREVFGLAGIEIGGRQPWDVRVRDPRFYGRVLGGRSLGLGESYMDGWWDCDRLELFFDRIYRVDLQSRDLTWGSRLHYAKARLFNRQPRSRAFVIGERHYDAGNDLYQAMLGPNLVYSGCLFAHGEEPLAAAEEAKLDLACRKLRLDADPGRGRPLRILDVGCGWASFGKWAAERYPVEVVGITVSKEQVELARERCRGLPVEVRLQDYREVQGTFDHVVSIGMVGHVGHKNYRTLMEVVHRSLAPDGLFLIHTMGANRSTTAADPWIDRYIFPDGMAPSIRQIGGAIERLFVMEDWQNSSTDYGLTCAAWLDRFEKGWPSLAGRYDERFHRMWRYYLCCFGGAFRARTLQTWDVVLSKVGGRAKYVAPQRIAPAELERAAA